MFALSMLIRNQDGGTSHAVAMQLTDKLFGSMQVFFSSLLASAVQTSLRRTWLLCCNAFLVANYRPEFFVVGIALEVPLLP